PMSSIALLLAFPVNRQEGVPPPPDPPPAQASGAERKQVPIGSASAMRTAVNRVIGVLLLGKLFCLDHAAHYIGRRSCLADSVYLFTSSSDSQSLTGNSCWTCCYNSWGCSKSPRRRQP